MQVLLLWCSVLVSLRFVSVFQGLIGVRCFVVVLSTDVSSVVCVFQGAVGVRCFVVVFSTVVFLLSLFSVVGCLRCFVVVFYSGVSSFCLFV